MSDNLFRDLDQQIVAFVQRPENRRLIAGTGPWSTPFRGTLFGSSDAKEITRTLRERPVDVLWMGSNPNVPESLCAILADRDDPAPLQAFQEQTAKDRYAQLAGDGTPKVGWSPARSGNWKKYADGLLHGSHDDVAMANFLPWGSANYPGFFMALVRVDVGLAGRVLAFANELHEQIVGALRPRLMLVPLSLGRAPTAEGMSQDAGRLALNTSHHQLREVKLPRRGIVQTFYVGEHRSEKHTCRVAFVPHPSSLRLAKEDTEVLMSEIAAAVNDEGHRGRPTPQAPATR